MRAAPTMVVCPYDMRDARRQTVGAADDVGQPAVLREIELPVGDRLVDGRARSGQIGPFELDWRAFELVGDEAFDVSDGEQRDAKWLAVSLSECAEPDGIRHVSARAGRPPSRHKCRDGDRL